MAAPTVDDLRDWVGGTPPAQSTDSYTARLSASLDAAVEQVEGRCLARYVDPADDDFTTYPASVRTAILMLGARLVARADAPSGVAGFDATGDRFLFPKLDADVESLISRYRKLDGFA